MNRRRALMAAQTEQKNGLVSKTGCGYGSSVVSVNSDGNIVLTTFKSAWSNRFAVLFKFPIAIKNNDIVRVVLTKISGSASSYNASAQLQVSPSDYTIEFKPFANSVCEFDKTKIKDVTVTSSVNGNVGAFIMFGNSANLSSSIVMHLSIYVNGKEVLP